MVYRRRECVLVAVLVYSREAVATKKANKIKKRILHKAKFLTLNYEIYLLTKVGRKIAFCSVHHNELLLNVESE